MATYADALFVGGILVSLVLCALGAYCYRRWDEPGVLSFATFACLLGLSGVAGGVLSLLLGPQTGDSVVWGLAGFVGMILWCLPWGLFGLQYTGRYTRLSYRTLGLLLVPHVFFVLFTVNQLVGIIEYEALNMLIGGVLGIYVFGLVAIGLGLVLKTTVDYGHLSLGAGITLGLVPVSHILVLNTSNTFSEELMISEAYLAAFGIPTIALGVAMFRYETFEATPAVGTIGEREIARAIDDLIFVLDDQHRLIKFNEASVEALGLSPETTRGQTLQETLGLDLATLREKETVTLETADGTRRYDSQVSTVTDQHGRDLGALVSLHDVTEHELREQRLTVLNRVLRHNLRNKVEVVKSHAEVLEAEYEEGHAKTISDAADSIADLGYSARAIDQFVSRSNTTSEVDLVATVEKAFTTLGEDKEAISVSFDLPESATVETNGQALTGALESAIDNALTYAESTVEITAEQRSDEYEITIADDGPGIPDGELDCLDAGTETALEHGTGLGLWQLKWAVTTMGGDLEFDTSDGTTVTFTVPATSSHHEP